MTGCLVTKSVGDGEVWAVQDKIFERTRGNAYQQLKWSQVSDVIACASLCYTVLGLAIQEPSKQLPKLGVAFMIARNAELF